MILSEFILNNVLLNEINIPFRSIMVKHRHHQYYDFYIWAKWVSASSKMTPIVILFHIFDRVYLQTVEISKIGCNRKYLQKRKNDENGWIKRPKNGPLWSKNAILKCFKDLFVFSMEYTRN